MLVDGALSSSTPVWAARSLGAEAVIAVRLKPEIESVARRSESPASRRLCGGRPPDFEILVDTRGYSSWSTRDVSRLIDLGRRTTESLLGEIRGLAGHNEAAAARHRAQLAQGIGVLVDAFLVRMTLVPAVLALVGERAWRLPRSLGRLLPDLYMEPEPPTLHRAEAQPAEQQAPHAAATVATGR
jgi:hypothetical protein